MSETVLKEYIPTSWFHPKGVYKVNQRLKGRLPNVNGCLFATLTLDRNYYIENWINPNEAFEESRYKIRKVFYKLRKGVNWEGKHFKIKAPYCVKVEFHDDDEGWPHFHIIWKTKRFVPCDLIEKLWGLGRINVKRITNSEFNYILKYVCKSGRIPNWVKRRRQIRIFQSSKGFLQPLDKKKPVSKPTTRLQQRTSNIRQRLNKWKNQGLVIRYDNSGQTSFKQVLLKDEFRILLDRLVYSIAQDGRYLGDGKIKINKSGDYNQWIKT